MKNEIFDLTVELADKVYKFQVTPQSWGDSKRYAIRVNDTGYLFEPESSGKFRFVVVPGQNVKGEDVNLLEAISKKLEELTIEK